MADRFRPYFAVLESLIHSTWSDSSATLYFPVSGWQYFRDEVLKENLSYPITFVARGKAQDYRRALTGDALLLPVQIFRIRQREMTSVEITATYNTPEDVLSEDMEKLRQALMASASLNIPKRPTFDVSGSNPANMILAGIRDELYAGMLEVFLEC